MFSDVQVRKVTAYYNENDPFAAQWLRNLISAGLIAKGEVDERDIRDVKPLDLAGYTQCHFFAGIGGWSYALRLAGWLDDKPVWTGSCPCQPFSTAGARGGFADERHLWPHFHWLIVQCRPAIVFGEQVSGAASGPWIDLVQDDLEGIHYAFGAISAPACSVGAPHIRQRLWWVAHASSPRAGRNAGTTDREAVACTSERGADRQYKADGFFADSAIRRLADADGGNAGAEWQQRGGQQRQFTEDGRADERMGDAGRQRLPQRGSDRRLQREEMGTHAGQTAQRSSDSFWSDADWLPCNDGKIRPVEPGTFPLAHGIPGRVGRLRAYGNSITPPLAALFIEAVMECAP
jgi:DNA (cytosine-5)-methyltransferase 1